MAVVDVLVSKVLDLLTWVVASEIEQKVKLVIGVDKEVKMLTNNLQSIKAVLVDAERRQLKEETIKLWLGRLKNISYDIDEVLDEWSTEILKSKIEGDGYEYPSKSQSSKVCSFVKFSCFCFREDAGFCEVFFRHDIAVKIKELNENLDSIAREKDRYALSSIQGNEQVIERSVTTSFVDMKDVKGREVDKYALIDLLLAKSSEIPNLHVISVVGMGGIGKTTLAKLVYNEVKIHFDHTIWICVSDPFDEIRIAKAILESLIGTASNLVELQNIAEQIQQCISGKRFLLVLDDVWNEDFKRWEQVKQFLKCGSLGSKILVTTRKENVARIMGYRDIIRLGLLSDKECWSIFSQIVFSDGSIEHNRSLEELGREIVARCKGLPLAVKTIAGLLRFKKSVVEWQSVLDSELWELEEVERDVLAPLLLSYYDLPSPLRQCFLHCVIFPKDYRMSKKQLIGMWMSQGYLRATQSKDIEMVGEEYFQYLAMRSFFQDFEEDYYTSSNMYCKMHDIIHDFAESVMKNKECCSIEVNESRVQKLDLSHNEIRHVGVMLGREVEIPSSFYRLKKLHSLSFIDCSSFGHFKFEVALGRVFDEFNSLRSLSLSECAIREIPSNISKLIHLRELDLSDNVELTELPETVCKLYNLQILNVDRCHRLKHLPRGIGKLINLRCLYNYECKCLLPKEIGKLSGLRRLRRINIGEEEEGYLSLRDVKNLNHLGGELSIVWGRQHKVDVDVKDAKEAQLKEKRNLTDLVLWFSEEKGVLWSKEEDRDELLEALELSPYNLKSLSLRNYKGSNKMRCSPSWIMRLTFLRQLVLMDWTNCEQLPTLGKLPSLESLQVYGFTRLKKVGGEFYGMKDHNDNDDETAPIILFPKLIELKFTYMHQWEEWNELEEEEEGTDDKKGKKEKRNNNNNSQIKIIIMPSLRSLTLYDCQKLKALPHYIIQNASLKLKIQRCYILEQNRIV